MKAEDLRILNLVYHDGKIVKVVGIDKEHVSILKDPLQCYFHAVPINGLDPIHLTEDILSKCGFGKTDAPEYYYVIMGLTVWKCNDIFVCENNGVVIKSLNQLQNIHYFATGKELRYNE